MTITGALRDEGGFTLVEMMIAALITLVIMGVAFTSFDNALALNEGAARVADAGQNLRGGTNVLLRDLMTAGRNLPVGGISIPSGAQAEDINRPGPTNVSMTFDTTQTTIKSITTGNGLGGEIAGLETDIITILMDDPFRDDLTIEPEADDPSDQVYPMLAEDGSYIDLGTDAAANEWAAGDLANGISPIAAGDLIYFSAASGTTLQMVTEVTEDGLIRFEEDDDFNLNQPDATAGSITQIVGAQMAIRRVLMLTYFVEEHDGAPRLMQRLNFHSPSALAGTVENLQFTYDLVDGEYDPVGVDDLPYVVNQSTTLTATQIRKVNVEVGVRSEAVDTDTQQYLRQNVSTVVSIRNLAFVSRYDLD